MYDKRKPPEDDSSASLQDVVRKDEGNYSQVETSFQTVQNPEHSRSSIPPVYYRQGYCSCCKVHYINLDKHLASEQHRKLSTSCNRNQLNTSMMMERFLQDVHHYHPQRYHDTRPSYDDIPEVNIPSLQEHRPHVLTPCQTEASKTTGSNIVGSGLDICCTSESCKSKNYSNKTTFTQSSNLNPAQRNCTTSEEIQQNITDISSRLKNGPKALGTAVNAIPHFSNISTLSVCPSNHLLANNLGFFETPHSMLNFDSKKNKNTQYGKGNKFICPNVTQNSTAGLHSRLFHSQGSYSNVISGMSVGKQSNFKSQEGKNILRESVLPKDSNSTGILGENSEFLKDKYFFLCRDDKTSVDDIIETVIKKYCHNPSSQRSSDKDEESVSSFNVQSVIGGTEGSSLSFDWNVPLQLEDLRSKTVITSLNLLRQSSVNIDEDYKSKLECVLSSSPEEEIKVIKPEQEEEVLQALPHVPPSFVGKTWSQIMYEDDLKIEALVREFREGKFRCYFEDEAVMNARRSRHHKKKELSKATLQTNDWKESEKVNLLFLPEDVPGEDHDSEVSLIKSEKVLRPKFPKPHRRACRQVSRCQVVKVSHGTQTSLVNYPVVKKKVVKTELHQEVFDFEEEHTPDMKTRLCALKLPESYTKILTPLQPKTLVYVLSHPDIKTNSGKAACISKRGRNQCSTDSRDSVYYKYKQSPVKYYDPLTNRILKTPPRNSVRGMGSRTHCVRKLFRSLSSEVNVDKVEIDQNEFSTKKSYGTGSVASLQFESTREKDLTASLKESVSSVSTEYIATELGVPVQPYANVSISSSSLTHVKEDIQHNSLSMNSKKYPLRPKTIIRSESKSLKEKTKAVIEVTTQAKINFHRMEKNLEKATQGKSRYTKQPKRKPAGLSKPARRYSKACRPSKKKSTGQNERSVRECKKTVVKSKFVSLKTAKRMPNMTKSVSKSNINSRYQDITVKRTQRSTSDIIVHTMPRLRSRQNTVSNVRAVRNTSRKVR